MMIIMIITIIIGRVKEETNFLKNFFFQKPIIKALRASQDHEGGGGTE